MPSTYQLAARPFSLDIATWALRTLSFMFAVGLLLRPSWVTVDKKLRQPLAIGLEAKKWLGAHRNVVVVRPIRDGVISEFDVTQIILNILSARSMNKALFLFRVRA